jgi:adenine C2-methylase RlmN of 23S rRNA A2503 and tRNA A37
MGEGEPLQNFDNVKSSVNFLLDVRRFNLAAKHITVSTVGVVKNIYRLTTELPRVKLALSLHAPSQELRLKIVTSASAHKIEKLMEAVDHHIEYNLKNKERIKDHVFSVMIEYILIKDVNAKPEHAEELSILLTQNIRKDHILLNLIPYNPTTVAEHFEAPTKENVSQFADICRSKNIMVRVRTEMGQDIAGACGQLALINPGLQSNSEHVDIEDIGKTTKNSKNMLTIKKKSSSSSSSSSSVISRFWDIYMHHGFNISISVFTLSGILFYAYNRRRKI